MKIQEASEDFTEREIMFLGPKTSYMEANTQKDGKTEI
jgi:cellobiose-specific phosphotransferase system component IIB